MMARGQHLIGKVLGSCVLKKVLGYGGSSAVFLAQQSNPEREVAVKVFLPRSALDVKTRRDFYCRFLCEAEAASQLDHANILPIYSYGEQDGLPYIIMPHMPGGTLSEYIAKHGPVSLQEAQWYLEQLASALDYAHEHGCVHCDVKPANILLNSEGHVVLSDFGIARNIQTNVPVRQPATQSPGLLMGTPDYISPEQAMGHALDGRSDIYSLGITVFYLLTKQLPFKADTTIAVALLHVHKIPPSLALIRADISVSLDRVLHKALAKNPKERFQTAGAFSEAFAHAVAASEQTRAMTPGSKRAKLLIRKVVYRMNATRSLLIVEKPALRVKSVEKRSFAVPRFVSVSALLLMTLFVTSFSAYFISAHIASGASRARLLATEVNGVHIDYLTDYDKWPISSTFFYDQHHQHYHILNDLARNVALASYAGSQFGNFHLTVTALEIHHPHDKVNYYGVVFRSTADQSQYYLFEVTAASGGQYAFLRYDGQWHALFTGLAPLLLTTPGKTNTITVDARGNTFTFFINEKAVSKPVTDPSSPLTTGRVGLYVEDQNAEVAFSHLYIDPSEAPHG